MTEAEGRRSAGPCEQSAHTDLQIIIIIMVVVVDDDDV